MKRIDEILYEAIKDINQTYGLGKQPLLKITVSHETFDNMVLDMTKITKYSSRISPSSCNDFEILGVRIEAREKL